MIKLIKPNIFYKEKMMDYLKEFKEENEVIHGGAGVDKMDYEMWLENLRKNERKGTVEEGFVPATTFIVIDDNDKIIGMIDIRHTLNDYLMNFGGHIGYSVRKSERQKGYATEMLKLALSKFDELSDENCLLTCDKYNIASAKVILKNGGILENEILEGDRIIQRYWIDMKVYDK